MDSYIFEQRFVQQHSETLQSMFSTLYNKDSEHFLYEIKRNLFSKTERMRKLERKKGMLPDGDIAANFESALKSAYYPTFCSLRYQFLQNQL